MPVQYSHLTEPLVVAKREKFDVYWFIGPLCILRQVLTFDLTNKMLMHVTKNVVLRPFPLLHGGQVLSMPHRQKNDMVQLLRRRESTLVTPGRTNAKHVNLGKPLK